MPSVILDYNEADICITSNALERKTMTLREDLEDLPLSFECVSLIFPPVFRPEATSISQTETSHRHENVLNSLAREGKSEALAVLKKSGVTVIECYMLPYFLLC